VKSPAFHSQDVREPLMTAPRKLFAETVRIDRLTEKDRQVMFGVFSKYYNNVEIDQFESDLLKKDVVFLLKDSQDRQIKGFSTLVRLECLVEDKIVRGMFSGDTIIEKEYWGQGTLGIAFLIYLFKEKLKRPFKPLYWFLISKGYKTYLLMANNFSGHYPRHEKDTPTFEKKVIDIFSETLYPDSYDAAKGVISFSKVVDKDCLKQEITPISKELLLKNRRIKFFAETNPAWEQGSELACIAEMTLSMPFYYKYKFILKKLKKVFANTRGNSLPSREQNKMGSK
jgi:hypothetical protein